MHEAEWQTRKTRIDTRLRALNPRWQIVRWRDGLDITTLTCHAVTEFPTANGPADYALFVAGVLLGILEAKKVAVNPQNVLEQAKRYSVGAFSGPGNWNGFRVPFLFASNGEIIWFLDVRQDKAASRQIAGFHTGPALEALFAFDPKPACDWLLDTPPDVITRLRDYQRRVEGLFALADQLEDRLAKARGQVCQLAPSLLARALRGRNAGIGLTAPGGTRTPLT